jgi:hypothetical protein
MTILYEDSDAEKVVQQLTAKEDLVSIMLDIEDYFDSNNLYAFDNWIEGVLVKGPIVKKYWIEATFKYAFKQMPDPAGGLRLTPHGTKISYRKASQLVPQPIKSPSDYKPGTREPKMKKEPIWLVSLKIPRRFVEAMNQDILDTYSDELDDSSANDIEDSAIKDNSNKLGSL